VTRARRLAGTAGALALAVLAACAAPQAPASPPAVDARGGTVWVWRGTRRIDGLVEIPAGVTLRLEPGTVLRFAFVDRDGDGVGDAGLHVLGRVEAVGAPGAPVVLTSAAADPQPGDWQGLLFDNSAGSVFTRCRIEYAQHALHAHFSSARLERCRLERNVEGTRLGNSRFVIERCLVRGNAGKGVNFFACANVIRRNRITGNADGLFLFETDADSVVEENDIFGNERYDVRLGDFYRGGKRIGATWFGTTDPAAIAARVFDGADDPELGRLEYTAAPGPFTRDEDLE
jgi:nitrous oxidase accessory protein NosD